MKCRSQLLNNYLSRSNKFHKLRKHKERNTRKFIATKDFTNKDNLEVEPTV